MRGTIAVVAGLITAALWVALIQGFGHWLYPPPAGLDTANAEDVARFVESAPPAAQAIVILAWFVATVCGGTIANMIARKTWPAWLVAGAVIALNGVIVLTIPHPRWMQLAAVIVPLIAVDLAGRISARLKS